MPQIFPLSSYGNRMINVTLDTGERGQTVQYWMRTYYSEGQINSWFLDMWDANMLELVKGLPIVIGAVNLLSGYAEKFPKGSSLVAVQTDGTQDNPDVLGNGLELVWYNGNEKSPFVLPDPMLAASVSDFVIPGQEATGDHAVLNNRFVPNQHNIQAIQGLAERLAELATIEQLNQKVGEAPLDGTTYGRRNASWVPTGSGGGSGGDGLNHFKLDGTTLTMVYDPENSGGDTPDDVFFYKSGQSLVLRQVAIS